ncbi:MAG: glycosyltransferase [Pseudomonadota bacterium]
MSKVCHFSSVHRGLDIRIYRKECVSLARAGHEVHLVIDATAAEVAEAAAAGVTLHRLAAANGGGRVRRMLLQAWRTYRIAKELDAQIYHIHDPELIPYGVLLARQGKQVILDLHEDLSADIHPSNGFLCLCAMPSARRRAASNTLRRGAVPPWSGPRRISERCSNTAPSAWR